MPLLLWLRILSACGCGCSGDPDSALQRLLALKRGETQNECSHLNDRVYNLGSTSVIVEPHQAELTFGSRGYNQVRTSYFAGPCACGAGERPADGPRSTRTSQRVDCDRALLRVRADPEVHEASSSVLTDGT